MLVSEERMNAEFNKLYLQIGKFPLTLHHFTGHDIGDAHDHPFSFETTVLAGGYTEQIWKRDTLGNWYSYEEHRIPGYSHLVLATDIHKIIYLPQAECITSVKWIDEVPRREPRFWQFNDLNQARSRPWNGDWEEWK